MNDGYVKTECIVIRKKKYRETSALIDVFSPVLGRHTLIAKGFFRSKRAFSSHLEPLSINIIEFFYKDSREIQTLTKAELKFHPDNIMEDLKLFELAAKSLRILRKQKYPTESVDSIFEALKKEILKLDEKDFPEKTYFEFLRSYLFIEGHLGDFMVREDYRYGSICKEIAKMERIIEKHES